MIVRLLSALLLFACGLATAQPAPAPPLVACASDLQFAMPELAAQYRRDTGAEVRLVFGSSGNLASQALRGAPFELFLSADESYVFELADRGLTRDRGVVYAQGHLVLFAPDGSPLAGRLSAGGLRAGLADGKLRRLAMANPEHAPYGRAARSWLSGQGLWEAVQPVLVLGENVSQAAQFALAGSQAAILPLSLVQAPQVGGKGSYMLLDAADHERLQQRMVLLAAATPAAQRFYQYLQSAAARAVLARHGFLLPGEDAAP